MNEYCMNEVLMKSVFMKEYWPLIGQRKPGMFNCQVFSCIGFNQEFSDLNDFEITWICVMFETSLQSCYDDPNPHIDEVLEVSK